MVDCDVWEFGDLALWTGVASTEVARDHCIQSLYLNQTLTSGLPAPGLFQPKGPG